MSNQDSVSNKFDLTGLIDLHIHAAPDVQPRYADEIQVAQDAQKAGMLAVLLKSHVTLTADRALLTEKSVDRLRVFGGLALNYPVGGLNPAAVEVAIKLGAKEIWMPTRSAAHVMKENYPAGGIRVLDEEGYLVPEVFEIMDLIREADIMLGTGHVSVTESVALVKASRERGLRKIVITHPEAPFIAMPVEVQLELSGEGVFFERCFVDTTAVMNFAVNLDRIAAVIRQVGITSTVLSTDFGQASNPPPVEGLRAYLSGLAIRGFKEEQIRLMAGDIPAYLLELDSSG
jgi:hypothetical protein